MTTTDRFRADLDALAPPGARLGIALSGGPDSLALLLLAAAARPAQGRSRNRRSRPPHRSRAEAGVAAAICARLGIPHVILTIDWPERPITALQERARGERYRLLAGWAEERELHAILTGHHADDQAETLLMRLNRGAGVRGLGGMRPKSSIPQVRHPRERGDPPVLLRPLLGWRRAELERICADANLTPNTDPSNADDRFERVRIRKALSDAGWIDSSALATSAAHLASADQALDWATDREWRGAVAKRTVASPTCLRMRQPKSSAASSREPSQR